MLKNQSRSTGGGLNLEILGKLFDNNHGIIAEVFGIADRVVTLPRKILLCPKNWGTHEFKGQLKEA